MVLDIVTFAADCTSSSLPIKAFILSRHYYAHCHEQLLLEGRRGGREVRRLVVSSRGVVPTPTQLSTLVGEGRMQFQTGFPLIYLPSVFRLSSGEKMTSYRYIQKEMSLIQDTHLIIHINFVKKIIARQK